MKVNDCRYPWAWCANQGLDKRDCERCYAMGNACQVETEDEECKNNKLEKLLEKLDDIINKYEEGKKKEEQNKEESRE